MHNDPEDEKKMWNHVKHLESQLEILAASHNASASGYNEELDHTLSRLAQQPDAANPNHSYTADPNMSSSSSMMHAQHTDTSEKQLWNAWDVRLNIGQAVGKWFGDNPESDPSATPATPATPSSSSSRPGGEGNGVVRAPLDLGADPHKTASSSLPYEDVLELNKRLSVIDALVEQTDTLTACRAKWQSDLARLQSSTERARANPANASSAAFQDSIALKLNALNATFLKRVDTTLHEIVSLADIWGEHEAMAEQLEEMSAQLTEFGERLRNEMDARAQLTNQASDLAARLGDEQNRTLILEDTGEKESQSRMELEQRVALLRDELESVNSQNSALKASLADTQAELHAARKSTASISSELEAAQESSRDGSLELDRLKSQLGSEKQLRDKVAKQAADLQIELTRALEAAELERNTVADLKDELATAKQTLRDNEVSADQSAERLNDKLIEVTELRLRVDELIQKNAALVAQLDEDEAQKEFLDSQKLLLAETMETANTNHARDMRNAQAQIAQLEADRDGLESQVELLFAELDELQNREETDLTIAELRRMLAEALEAKKDMDALVISLRGELEAAQDALADTRANHEAHLARIQSSSTSIESARDAAAAEVSALKDKVDELKNGLHAENKKQIQLRGSVDHLKTQTEELKKMNAILEAEKDVLRTELTEFEQDLEKEVHAHACKREELSKMEREKADWKAKFDHEHKLHLDALRARDAAQAEKVDTEKLVSQLSVTQSSSAHTLDEARRQLESMTRERDHLLARREDMLTELEAQRTQYDDLADTRISIENALNDTKRDLGLAHYQIAELTKALEDAKREASGANARLDQVRSAKASLEAQIAHTRNKLELEAAEKSQATVHAVTLERNVAKVSDDLAETKSALASEEKRAFKLQQELDTAVESLKLKTKAYDELKVSLDSTLRENQDLVSETRGLEDELSMLRRKLHGDVAEKDALARANETKDAEIDRYRAEIEDLTAQKYAVEQELEKATAAITASGRDKATFELEKMSVAQSLGDAQKRLELKDAELEETLEAWRSEKDRYEAKILDLEAKHSAAIANLQKSLDAAYGSMESMTSQTQLKYSDLEDEINHYKKQLHAALVREEELVAKAAALKQETDAAVGESAAAEARAVKADEELRHLQLKLTKAQTSQENALARVSALEDDMRELARSNAALSSSSDSLSMSEAALKERVALVEADLLEKKRALRMAKEEAAQLDNDVKTASLEIARLSAKLDKDKFDTESTATALAESKAAYSSLAKENDSLKVAADAATAEVSEYKNKCRDLLQTQSNLTVERDALKAQLEQLKGAHDSLLEASQHASEAASASANNVADLKSRLGTYQRHMHAPPTPTPPSSRPRLSLSSRDYSRL